MLPRSTPSSVDSFREISIGCSFPRAENRTELLGSKLPSFVFSTSSPSSYTVMVFPLLIVSMLEIHAPSNPQYSLRAWILPLHTRQFDQQCSQGQGHGTSWNISAQYNCRTIQDGKNTIQRVGIGLLSIPEHTHSQNRSLLSSPVPGILILPPSLAAL